MQYRFRFPALLSACAVAALSAFGLGVSAETTQEEFQKGNYTCVLWNSADMGTSEWDVSEDGSYTCTWDGVDDVMFRTGYKPEEPVAWESLAGLQIDYECTEFQVQGNAFLCAYGFLTDPLVEYYIVEDYTTWRPPTGGAEKNQSYEKIGAVTIGGGAYDIYRGTIITSGFDMFDRRITQYWSVRQHGFRRRKGTIDAAAHFKAWEDLGLSVGSLHTVSLCVDGYRSSGSAVISKNLITTGCGGGEYSPVGTTTTPEQDPNVTYTAPTGTKNTIYDRFEDTATSWTGRGTDAFGFAEGFTHGGKQAFYVTNRTECWHGLSAASDELIPGHSYDFDGYAAINSKDVPFAAFVLGLEYTKDGETVRQTLAENSAASGKWAKLETSFEIPAGAANLSLFVQTAESENPSDSDLVPFYLDDVILVDWNEPVASFTVSTEFTSTARRSTVRGDLDCSGAVELRDAVMLAKAAVGIETGLTADGLANGDLNKSGGLDSGDLTLLLRYLAGITDTL